VRGRYFAGLAEESKLGAAQAKAQERFQLSWIATFPGRWQAAGRLTSLLRIAGIFHALPVNFCQSLTIAARKGNNKNSFMQCQ
jgi:hypothetical protein